MRLTALRSSSSPSPSSCSCSSARGRRAPSLAPVNSGSFPSSADGRRPRSYRSDSPSQADNLDPDPSSSSDAGTLLCSDSDYREDSLSITFDSDLKVNAVDSNYSIEPTTSGCRPSPSPSARGLIGFSHCQSTLSCNSHSKPNTGGLCKPTSKSTH